MGRHAYRTRARRSFVMVSPDRLLSSGYLSLLLSHDGFCGFGAELGGRWYSGYYSVDSYVVKVMVGDVPFYDDPTDYGHDDTNPFDALNSLTRYLENHEIAYTVDMSHVEKLTPDKRFYEDGCRCSGYHLVLIPCVDMSEDTARLGFDSDVSRWDAEEADMERRDLATRERRKKRGIEKRKATMARKREEREKAAERSLAIKASNEARREAIQRGMSVGNVRGLECLGDRLFEIWGNNSDFSYCRSLVMCEGVDLSVLDLFHYEMPYGKHRGMRLSDIRGNYCEWLFGCKVDGIMGKGEKPDTLYYHLVRFFMDSADKGIVR